MVIVVLVVISARDAWSEPPAAEAATATETAVPVEPKEEIVDRRTGTSVDDARLARGWERPPVRPTRSAWAWIGRGFGMAAYVVLTPVLAPARGAIYLESRHETFSKIKRVFYNDAETAGVVPVISFVSGFGLSFGANAFHKDLFGNDEELSLRAMYGFSIGQEVQLKTRFPHLAGDRAYLEGRARFEHRNNLLFSGIGSNDAMTGTDLDPRSAAVPTRYEEERWLGSVSGGAQFRPRGYQLRTGVSGIFNHRRFGANPDPSLGTPIADVYDTSALVGFDDGFDLLELSAVASLDTRKNDGPESSGVAINGFAGGPVLGDDFSYVHYGFEAAVYLQPWWPRRMLVLRFAHEGVLGSRSDIPFTELPRVGGAGLLRGYKRDQFRDKLANVATVEYHYPIHENLSGQFFLEAGKVASNTSDAFGSGLSNDWNVGAGGGLLVHTRSGMKLRFDVAYGDGLQFYFSTDVLEAFDRRGKEL